MAENFFGITDTGRQRTNNEDAFIAEKIWNDGYVMACVIDGVGGYEGGEVAAHLTKETIQHYFSIPSGEIITMMQEAMFAANEKIRNEKRKNQQLESMACVVTLAIVDVARNQFYYAHVGDTRLYLYRDGALVKITKDHSFVGFLEDNGRLTEDAAMTHPKRNEIDKALGFDNGTAINAGYIETGQSPFLPGDALLLCSDGLTDMLTQSEITALYQNGKTLADKAKALVEAANKKGGKDNITVVLVQNNSKPLKVKATKPIVVKKKNAPEQKQQAPIVEKREQAPVVPKGITKSKSNKGIVLFLSILCLVLLAAVGYLLWQSNKTKLAEPASPHVFLESESERKLVDTLGSLTGNNLVLLNAFFGNPITLTDTLSITKDSLRLTGNANTVIIAGANYNSAAIEVAKGIQNIFIDSITFKNFNTGIIANDATLHLKGVRFINCSTAVHYGKAFPDSMAISGTIRNGNFVRQDSTIKSSKD